MLCAVYNPALLSPRISHSSKKTKNLGIFYWTLVLETKIWLLGMFHLIKVKSDGKFIILE